LPLSVTVLLSGGGTTFDAIQSYSQRDDSGFNVTDVISDTYDAYGLTRARNAGCRSHYVNYNDYEDRADFDEALLRATAETSPDLVVLAGFMRIVNPEFVRAFSGKLINIHPSLLPSYPGLNTYQRALQAGDSEHGSTVHFVNDVLDGGPLIAQAIVNIETNDTPKSLSTKVQRAERILYPVVIHWFASGRLIMRDSEVWLNGAKRTTPIRGIVNIHNNEEFEFDEGA